MAEEASGFVSCSREPNGAAIGCEPVDPIWGLVIMRAENEAERFARLNQIWAERVGGEPEDETEHMLVCPTCGQAFDMRNLGEAFYHYKPKHKPRARS
jgi:hypothetical protein